VRQLSADDGEKKKYAAEPESGALWKFLGLGNAGGVAFDERLSARLFPHMSVRSGADESLEDLSMPWKLYALDQTEGFRSVVRKTTEEMLRSGLVAGQLMFLLMMALRLQEAKHNPQGLERPRAHWPSDRDWRDFGMESPNEAALQLVHTLGRLGAVSPGMAQTWLDHERGLSRRFTEGLRHFEETGGDPRSLQVELRELLSYANHEGAFRHPAARGFRRMAEEILMQWERL
jgi:hypothetical protein